MASCRLWTVPIAILAILTMPLGALMAAGPASEWHQAYNSRVRLLAGQVRDGAGGARLYAAVEIRMSPGWKTYWRTPGDAGGVPPAFAWNGSVNLASARVLFPAPQRLTDSSGDSIGYKDGVVFPVAIVPTDPSQPVELRLGLDYGICHDLCVPTEARLTLTIPPGGAVEMPAEVAAALARVPHADGNRSPTDPALQSAEAQLGGAQARLVFDVVFPGGSDSADVFLEAPEGLYLPQPKRAGAGEGAAVRFMTELSHAEAAELKGKVLRLTMVTAAAAAETTWRVPEGK